MSRRRLRGMSALHPLAEMRRWRDVVLEPPGLEATPAARLRYAQATAEQAVRVSRNRRKRWRKRMGVAA